MRLKFYFIACLVTLNALFIGYAVGFNSRHVLIVDPKLSKYVAPVLPTSVPEHIRPHATADGVKVNTKTKEVAPVSGHAKPNSAPSGHNSKPQTEKTGSIHSASTKAKKPVPASKHPTKLPKPDSTKTN